MKDVQSFARQILKALEYMHTLRLTHTDLKPENILLIEDTLECDNERVIN
jgi:serine/threonine protein kinase